MKRLAVVALAATLASSAAAEAQPTTRPDARSAVASALAGSTQRLDAARQALAEAGVALTAAELAERVADVPPGRNAAENLQAAFAELERVGDTGALERLDGPTSAGPPPLPGERPIEPRDGLIVATWDDVAAVVAERKAALAALDGFDATIRPAVNRVEADFGVDYRSPDEGLLVNVELPYLNQARALANLLGWKLLLDAQAGRHDFITQDARWLIGLSDALDDGHPVLVGHVVAVGIDALAADRLRRIARLLDVGGGEHQASPAELRQLITLLLDADAEVERYRTAVQGEATVQQNAVGHLLRGGDGQLFGMWRGPLWNPLLVNLIRDSGSLMADISLEMLPFADLGTAPAFRERARAVERHVMVPDDEVHRVPLAAVLLPSLRRSAESNYRIRNERALAAIALAVRLYRADHGGALPPTLGALVPDYLPAVPTDVMAADGPLRYDADRGVAWSVGEDGEDDGGRSLDDVMNEHPNVSARELRDIGYDEVVQVKPLRY